MRATDNIAAIPAVDDLSRAPLRRHIHLHYGLQSIRTDVVQEVEVPRLRGQDRPVSHRLSIPRSVCPYLATTIVHFSKYNNSLYIVYFTHL